LEATVQVPPPSEAELAHWVLSAPPMVGGEYLSGSTLMRIWNDLGAWVQEEVNKAGDVSAFLATHAPKWHQVGRVCFHLAENKSNAHRPFAFMATYATGFSTGGKLKHLPLGRALEQYAGTKHKAALVKLLTPVHAAAQACAWVHDLVESGGVFRPQAWTPQQAYKLLQSVPQLEASGLTVRLPDWWKKRPRPQVAVTIGGQKQARLGVDALLDFNVTAALGGQHLTHQEVEDMLSGEDGLVFIKGQWAEVDRAKLREALDHWKSVQRQAGADGVSFIEGMRLLAGASADLKHEPQAEESCSWAHVEAGAAMRDLLTKLRQPDRLTQIEPGNGLRATLRPYQREGVAWLDFLTRLGLGACLADDMGLGKTIQVLALLLNEKSRLGKAERRPSLLVVPASLLSNWQQEAMRFTPKLTLAILHPSETDRDRMGRIADAPQRELAGVDLAVTTYAMTARQEWLTRVKWHLLILDEAQAIKNPGARQSKAVKQLDAHARIALTGTPVENRVGDLWSLFDFLNPGLLGSSSVFKSFVKQLQQRESNQFAPLRRLVGPYILRRLKTDRSIIADLPDKTEASQYCILSKAQAKLYNQTVQAMTTTLASVDGMARRGLVLQTLMRLKQICNHPSQLQGDGDYKPTDSGKFARLAELSEELAERQDKVLIFTQFREIIDPLAEYLQHLFGRPGLTLHGGTPVKRRRQIVEQFQREDGPPFFVLSLKAGGTGLNLTAASHVIHFDRWWNPAVENQATDRAFRIGQKQNVLVHKFITRGTVEQRIDDMIQEKRDLADQLLSTGSGDGEVNLTELPDEQIIDLVRLDANQAML